MNISLVKLPLTAVLKAVPILFIMENPCDRVIHNARLGRI